jgi:hypothetical protein
VIDHKLRSESGFFAFLFENPVEKSVSLKCVALHHLLE